MKLGVANLTESRITWETGLWASVEMHLPLPFVKQDHSHALGFGPGLYMELMGCADVFWIVDLMWAASRSSFHLDSLHDGLCL